MSEEMITAEMAVFIAREMMKKMSWGHRLEMFEAMLFEAIEKNALNLFTDALAALASQCSAAAVEQMYAKNRDLTVAGADVEDLEDGQKAERTARDRLLPILTKVYLRTAAKFGDRQTTEGEGETRMTAPAADYFRLKLIEQIAGCWRTDETDNESNCEVFGFLMATLLPIGIGRVSPYVQVREFATSLVETWPDLAPEQKEIKKKILDILHNREMTPEQAAEWATYPGIELIPEVLNKLDHKIVTGLTWVQKAALPHLLPLLKFPAKPTLDCRFLPAAAVSFYGMLASFYNLKMADHCEMLADLGRLRDEIRRLMPDISIELRLSWAAQDRVLIEVPLVNLAEKDRQQIEKMGNDLIERWRSKFPAQKAFLVNVS